MQSKYDSIFKSIKSDIYSLKQKEISRKTPPLVQLDTRILEELVAKILFKMEKYDQIEAARRAISRHVKRGGRIWIRVFPDKPISTKPAEVRMGNGKGNPEYYVAEIQPGKIVFEIVGVPEELAREAFRLAAAKLPLRTTFVSRHIGS